MALSPERKEFYLNITRDPKSVYVLTDPDAPLDDFLHLIGIKRMMHIDTDRAGKPYVLSYLKQFAGKRDLDYEVFDASQASVDDIRGELEFVFIDGKPYSQRKPPKYWPQQRKKLIVVEGVNQGTDMEVLRAFVYVASTVMPGEECLLDALPKGSGFVFLANGDFPIQKLASFKGSFTSEYLNLTWPAAPPHTSQRTIYETRVALRTIAELYDKRLINRRGKTKDSPPEWYTEVIAGELLQAHIDTKLQSLAPIERENYNANHDGQTLGNRREEEMLAKELFGLQFDYLGRVFDYQVPLKRERSDKAGKIDLVSYNKNENIVWLLELKACENKETLLRCILEIATYYQLLHKENFIASYSLLTGVTPERIRKGVLVTKDSYQHQELKDLKNRPNVAQLARLLEISFFLLKKSSNGYTVKEFYY
jgi:hypothetical protein